MLRKAGHDAFTLMIGQGYGDRRPTRRGWSDARCRWAGVGHEAHSDATRRSKCAHNRREYLIRYARCHAFDAKSSPIRDIPEPFA